MITIVDVAHAANVSVSTASRILNGGTKGLRKDAAVRAAAVLTAAEKLGYRANPAARSLVLRRSFTIGVVATEIGNPVRAELIGMLRSISFERGFGILTTGVEYGENPEAQLDHLLTHRVDGLILSHLSAYSPERLLQLERDGIPFVGFGGPAPVPCDNLLIDYPEVVGTMTSHLIHRHGLRRICFAGNRNSSRIAAYQRTMRENGLKIRVLTAGRCTLEEGRRLGRTLLDGTLPEAVVCHNDLLALGLMAGLREGGIQVPEDLLVTGVDNISFAGYSHPTLTTAGVDSGELSAALCERLFARIDHPEAHTVHEAAANMRFFFRESCPERPL